MSLLRAPPTVSLFAQVLSLVVLTLVGAIVMGVLITYNVALPPPDFYRLGEIAKVVKGAPGATSDRRRPLVTRVVDQPPQSHDSDGDPMIAEIERQLGDLIGVPGSDIVITSSFARFPDRDVIRLVHQQLIREGAPGEELFVVAPFKLAVRRADGRWLLIEPKPTLVPSPWQTRLMLWLLSSTLALTPFAYLFALRLAQPIAVFAAAAERLGRDPGAPPLPLKGPTEIAMAARAFNDMQERLALYVSDRTAMVGAIAHDLRTPLTRLRFRAESTPEDVRRRMVGDIAEMEAMISGVLAFVRDAGAPTRRMRLELSSLLESLVDELSNTGLDVAIERADRVVLEGDPIALRRLFNNLLDNAVKFGGLARVGVYSSSGFAVVEIKDDGAGLPAAELDRVFEPFYRHEASRSRETGGIGLGLAVVRSISRAHGGDASLANCPGGGLLATVQLPTGEPREALAKVQ